MMDRFDLDVLILTCGVQGSYVFAGRYTLILDTPHVKVADTVGAGDSFTAAFCAAVLKGKQWLRLIVLPWRFPLLFVVRREQCQCCPMS